MTQADEQLHFPIRSIHCPQAEPPIQVNPPTRSGGPVRRPRGGIEASQQFTPITSLMQMHSGDFHKPIGEVFDHEYAVRKTGHTPDESTGAYPYGWDKLRDSVQREGITTPVRVADGPIYKELSPHGMLFEGHHRSMMAIEQGHLMVPSKRYDSVSGYIGAGDDAEEMRGNRRFND
jgi:hypothetical protein